MAAFPFVVLVAVVLEASIVSNSIPASLDDSEIERSPRRSQAIEEFDPPDRGTPEDGLDGGGARQFEPPDRGTPGTPLDGGSARYVPPQGDYPVRPGSAGTRGKCPQDEVFPEPPLTALVPRLNPEEGDWALTVSPRPTLWVYVPETVASEGIFVLRDRQWNDLYRQEVALSEAGILELELPEAVEALAAEEDYRWQFAIVCPADATNARREIVTEGWVRRVEPSEALTQELEGVPERNEPLVYGLNGIWYDALSGLARQVQASPSDEETQQRWQEFLESAGLAEFSEVSVLESIESR
ncbi:DUF928 domain-containing protein [Baaleninema simplex]|uniref:DUF928 domain-containing protein n=1 Tax=Baaleninema simplex TaxID=2862350 RepID=UPI00034CD3FF|nr:DUF928 domain-containing protein [Baaleninema simplex]